MSRIKKQQSQTETEVFVRENIATDEDRNQRKKKLILEDMREERINSIQNYSPNQPSKLIADLKWMSQKGVLDDVKVLLAARRNKSFSQETIELIDYAVKQIANRDYQQRKGEFPKKIERMRTPNPEESGQIEAIREEIINYAIEVMESEDLANRWLASSRHQLGGLTPNDVLVTKEGCAEVQHLLGIIDYGVYA
jgi:uncharacterized protein (DUF2384 family)